MIQNMAALIVNSDYQKTSSVTSTIQQRGWPTLQDNRAKVKAAMMRGESSQYLKILVHGAFQ
jgi:hypothetical protein